MKVNPAEKEIMEKANTITNCTNGTNAVEEEENRNCKAHLKALQAEFENMEESLRNMLRHNGPTSDNEKDDTRRQMHAYKNAIAKFRNHINIVERENYALKRQMTSQSSHNSPEDVGRQKSSGNPDKSQLDDIRDTCLILSDRIKRMEDQNNQLLMNAEKQRSDYERCLDRVANQFVQALLSQQRLQMECDKLRRQLYEVTGNKAVLVPGSPVHNAEELVASPNGYPRSGDSVSDDAFVSSPTYPRSAPPCFGARNPIANMDGLGLFSPIQSAPQCGINRDENFNFNPLAVASDAFPFNVQMLKKYFLAPPDHAGKNSSTIHQNSPPEYDKNTCRSQSSKLSPLRSIPEASETCLYSNENSGHFRPRLTRCGSEILSSVSSAGDIFSSVPGDEDMSRSRERQRSSKSRNKVARSRSFDNNSYEHSDNRRHEDRANMLSNYRPGPPLNCLPTDRIQTRRREATDDRHAKVIREDAKRTNVGPSVGCYSNVEQNTPVVQQRQLAEETNCINAQVTSLQAAERQSREQTDQRVSQRSRTVMGPNLAEVSSGLSRNAFQRSFCVPKSTKRNLEHFPIADDVWLPRLTSSRSRPSTGGQNIGGGRKRSSHSKVCIDLPPPPPPPPVEEDEYHDVNRTHPRKELENPQYVSKQDNATDVDVKPKTRRNPDQTSSDVFKKQALAKRESYTAACRKSQSLDHLYEMIDKDDGKMELLSKSSSMWKENQGIISSSSFSTFDIHGEGNKCSSSQGIGSSSLPSSGHLANQTKTPSSNNKEPILEVPQTLNPSEVSRTHKEEDTANKISVLTKSQLPPPRSRHLKKGSKSETSLVKQTPRQTYVTKATVDLSPTTSAPNQLKSDTLQSAAGCGNQPQLPAANSYEILPMAKSNGQEQRRRASEGAVRNISGNAKKKSRLAAPSFKQSQLSKKETRPKPVEDTKSSDATATNKVKDVMTCVSTYNVNNLPGNRPGLTSKSFSDLTSKTPGEISVPISSVSHTNLATLTKHVIQRQVIHDIDTRAGNCERLQSPDRNSIGTCNKERLQNQHTVGTGLNRPKPILTYSRSQSVELKPASTKLRGVLQNRSVSSERNVKSAATGANNRARQRQKSDCDVVNKSGSGKKKGGHPRSFVDIMKSKFGVKNNNSQSKKGIEKTQENIQSVIDPRTLSLEPTSNPPAYGKGSKGSKKKSEDVSTQDPVGKKLSQPFLNKAPLESLAEVESVRSDAGGKRSFLSRQNSKRNAARLARLTNNERMNNGPFGRVELIPIGSRVSLSAISNPEVNSNPNSSSTQDYGTYTDNQDPVIHVGCNMNGEPRLGGWENSDHRGIQEMQMNRRRNDYENVVLHGDQDQTEAVHTYENAVIVNSSPCHVRYDAIPYQTGHSDLVLHEACSDHVNNNVPISNEEYFTVNDMTKTENPSVENLKSPKSSKLSGTAFSRIWGSISSHSLNKDADSNAGSKNALHQIGGGRGVSGDGKGGKKAAMYANEQKRFESAFISSVVSSELAQKAIDVDRYENATASQYENVHVVSCNLTSSNVAEQTSSCVRLLEDCCSSQTEESGKSSMSCSTTGSSKSTNSSFDSWPSNNGDSDKRNPSKRGGSLDACYRNIKTPEEMNGVAAKDYHQSPQKIGSRSSLGSFGYGSGVSSNSASSCSHNSSSLHDRTVGEQIRGRSVLKGPQSPRDSSSDADMAPLKSPKPAANRFTAHRSLSPLANNGSRLQKPSRLVRLNASNRGRIKMGVSSISTESCIQENNNISQPLGDAVTQKLAPLSYGLHPGQIQIPKASSALRSGRQNESCRPSMSYSTSGHVASRLPSHTAMKYIPPRQQHV